VCVVESKKDVSDHLRDASSNRVFVCVFWRAPIQNAVQNSDTGVQNYAREGAGLKMNKNGEGQDMESGWKYAPEHASSYMQAPK
jgi:hypothetical protein